MAQEVKVDVVPNIPGNVAKTLRRYVQEGYIIDSHSVELAPNKANNLYVTIVIHKERVDAWN